MVSRYACHIESCSVLAVELWAILTRIQLAWERGFKSLLKESDPKIAISLLSAGCVSSHICYPIIQRINEFAQQGTLFYLKHIFREANE